MATIPSSSELLYFIEVSNTSNVSRAAERLGISQPTLSLAIQRLEASLGTPLLIRSKSGVKLTHAGQKFLGRARQLVHEWERLRDDTLKEEDEIRGRYVIGAHPSVALYLFPDLIPTLLGENVNLELKLTHDLSRKITEDVISFKTDFGIVVNPWKHPDLVIKTLGKDEVALWTARKPSKLQDVEGGEAVLICDPDLVQSQSILRQLSKQGLDFKRVLTSSNLEVVAALVASGAGVGILPGRVAGRVESYGLKPLGTAGPKFADSHCLVYRADAQNSKASRLLARRILELCASPKKSDEA
jgi:LysR family transcriptional regulator, cell division regulator